MPHLYLPSEHTDADLVLAADVAAAVSSSDLYVAWTHDAGQAAPEVQAVVRDERPAAPAGFFAELCPRAGLQRPLALAHRAAGPARSRPRSSPRGTGRPTGEPSL